MKNKKVGSSSSGVKIEENEILIIKNLKTQFRRVCEKYVLKNKNQLYYKKPIKHKLNNGKYETNIEEFYIPTIEESNKLL